MENKSKNTSEISQWIDNYLHISINTEEYVEVRNFLILWNIFEAKWFKCNFGRNKCNIQNIHLASDIVNQTLQYLQRRYITNGSTNERFKRLRLRNNDDTTSVQRVLLGQTNNSCDIIKAIIMIIYRYRNNLFHGEKAIASLPIQKDNFIYANKFLIACLEAAKYGQTNEKYKENSRKSSTAGRKPITYSRASNFGSKNEM